VTGPDPSWWARERREGYAAARMLAIVLNIGALTLIVAALLTLVHATRAEAWALIVLAVAGVGAAMHADRARKRAGRR